MSYNLRDDADHVPGQLASQNRIVKWNGPRAAFNSLDIFDAAAAEEYLKASVNAVAKTEAERERVTAVCMNFAMVAVEADREMNGDSTPPPPPPRPEPEPEEEKRGTDDIPL